MAVDKIVDGTALDNNLTSVANAIRTKGGTSGSLSFPSGFVSAINAIGGGDSMSSDVVTISASGTGSFTLSTGNIDGTKIKSIGIGADNSFYRIMNSSAYIKVGDSYSVGTISFTVTAVTSTTITINFTANTSSYDVAGYVGKAR